MNIRESSFGYWSSQRAFLAVASGAALGIGSSIRLPHLMSEHGGLQFLAAYIGLLLVIGLPILVGEWALGRWMRDELGAGYARLAQAAGAHRGWRWLGRVSVAGGALILSYYAVIAGWSLGYMFRGAIGALGEMSSQDSFHLFLKLVQDPERSLAWHTIFMVMVTVIVSYGFRDGIERAARVLMPAILLLVIGFVVLTFRFGEWRAAMDHVLDGEGTLGLEGWFEALYLAFWTLGLGVGVMMTLGAYLRTSAPLVRLAGLVIAADCVFGFTLGMALTSVLTASSLPAASGLSLMFQSFPQALPANGEGVLASVIFYLIMVLVTLLAAATLLEPLTRLMMERYRLTRVFAATGGAVVVWFLGIGTILSFGIASNIRLLDQNFFEWIQLLTSFFIVPCVALAMCIFIARILPLETSLAVWGGREQALHGAARFCLRYPARIATAIIVLHGLGAFDWLSSLWLS